MYKVIIDKFYIRHTFMFNDFGTASMFIEMALTHIVEDKDKVKAIIEYVED